MLPLTARYWAVSWMNTGTVAKFFMNIEHPLGVGEVMASIIAIIYDL